MNSLSSCSNFSRIKPFLSQLERQDLRQYLQNSWLIWLDPSHVISANNCMWILTACYSGSLKFYSPSAEMHHCIKSSHLERHGAGLFDQAAVNSPLCLFHVFFSQRPEPQGGAAVRQWERWSHAESPELFYFKSTPQSLLPGREGSRWRRMRLRCEIRSSGGKSGVVLWDWIENTQVFSTAFNIASL